ncbi:MAG: TatD family hydrolase [Alphaproteobacteria bacterium]|jgi:TatD DNase family protein|nr:LuxR family transcriptional regulator [Rhodospirillaceae bacterium]MDP6406551.1 TatD family hydrolase [Alphaproteobacteria bacterium]MDP6623568.1 TatD family hydrolase [Alphaproteobacteria bacterium]|tara:strand:- start:1874 stop:2662 length:789 start_codon:yes stop_codon:yes gene_type:complete
MLVDSHCHLDYLAGEEDLDQVLDRAREAGVGGFLTISTRLDSFPEVLAIAERYEDVWCSVGVHPHEAAHYGDLGAAELVKLARHPKVVGIGESGLDYHYRHSPPADQQACFRVHATAARESGLPLIVHTREAEQDTLTILAEELALGAFPGLIHCFSGTKELAEKSMEIGFYLSIPGIITFNSAKDLQAVVRELPPQRLLVETDAPYLAPVPKRGRRNEPAYVAHTAAALANLLEQPAGEIERITTDNFFTLFSKAYPGASR